MAHIRNGFAELVKISSCAHLPTFNLLDKYCEQLIDSSFGHKGVVTEEVRVAARDILMAAITEMLNLETPDLFETRLERAMNYGHTYDTVPFRVLKRLLTDDRWSPTLELVPSPPLRHGHAVSIDMAYSASLASQRNLLTQEDYLRLLSLLSRAGLSLDHDDLNKNTLSTATKAVLETREGSLHAPAPSPLGQCAYLNDVSMNQIHAALDYHRATVMQYPRRGRGIELEVQEA